MTDALLHNIIEKQDKFEQEHIKIRNESIFNLFQNYGIPFLQTYCNDAEKFDYQVDENGITIKIVVSQLVMMPDAEKEFLELFKLASSCFIESNKNNKLSIHLWVRGWLWIKK